MLIICEFLAPKTLNTNAENSPTGSASKSTSVAMSNNRTESDYENDGQTTDGNFNYLKSF